MDTAIITTIITAATTLVVSMGTWHVTAKQARKKEAEELRAEMTKLIESYREELSKTIHGVGDDVKVLAGTVSDLNKTVEKRIAVVDMKIETLSERVEKHNNVIERTYKLEERTEVQEERIKVANHRIEDLEAKLK